MSEMSEFDKFLRQQLAEDPGFRKEWERSEALYSVIGAVLRRRHELGLSQSELAARMGKQQPAIARFEAGNSENPTLAFIQQLAGALDAQLTIRLEPKHQSADAARRIAEDPSSYAPS